MEITNTNQGAFNQAFFMQQRLHELFLRIDHLSLNLFQKTEFPNLWNYELVFSDLNTIYLSVSAKLTQGERDKLEKLRKELRQTMRRKLPFDFVVNETYSNHSNKSCLSIYQNQDAITDKLFYFRLTIEEVMDKHHLSNPSKLSPDKAAVN